MKKRLLYIVCATMALSFGSCTRDNDEINNTLGEAVLFSGSTITATTKVSGTAWDDGDAIGITVTSEDPNAARFNAKYTTMGGSPADFSPADDSQTIYFSERHKALSFSAYYPYQEDWTADEQVIDLSKQYPDNLEAYDFMRSEVIENQTEGAQALKFSHEFSQIQFRIKNYEGHNPSEVSSFSNLKIYLNDVNTQCDFTNNTYSNSNTIQMNIEVGDDNNSATATAILFPTQTEEGSWIMINAANKSYYTELPIITRQAGMIHIYDIEIGEPEVEISFKSESIEEWDNHDSNPSEILPEVDGVFTINNDFDFYVFYSRVLERDSFEGKTIKLAADVSTKLCGEWAPYQYYGFKGTFDGCGHQIKDLNITNSELAFFPKIESQGVVKNLVLGGGGTTVARSAAIAYSNYGQILNCHNRGFVINITNTTSSQVGAFASFNQKGGVIANCSNTVDITASGAAVGGIAAYNWGTIGNCYNTGNFTVGSGKSYIAGIAGSNEAEGVIKNCYSAAKFNESNCGGITDNDKGVVENCYYDSELYNTNNAYGATPLTTAEMKSTKLLFALNRYLCKANNAEDASLCKGYIWGAEGGKSYPTFDGERIEFAAADIFRIANDYCQIDNNDDFEAIAPFTNNYDVNANFKLNTSIHLDAMAEKVPIEYKGGTFDGDNHFIIGDSRTDAIFESVKDATIKNIGLQGKLTIKYQYAGSLVNFSYGTCVIENCYNTCYLEVPENRNNTQLAGILLSCRDGHATIVDCYNTGNIKGYRDTAGIIANSYYRTQVDIINCYNSGDIYVEGTTHFDEGGGNGDSCIAGIAANLYGGNANIVNCYNSGSITFKYGCAGIVKDGADTCNVINCCNVGELTRESENYKVYPIGDGILSDINNYYITPVKDEPYDDSYGEMFATSDNGRIKDLLNNGAYKYNSTATGYKSYSWLVDNAAASFNKTSAPTYSNGYDDLYSLAGEYKIFTAKGLTSFASIVNGGKNNVNAELKNDIVLSGAWTSIGADESTNYYSGTFNGDGYSINGSVSAQALFAFCKGATIKNLNVGGSVSNTDTHAAIIAGKASNNTTIENCETLEGSTVTANGGSCHGGIVAYTSGVRVNDCINRADVNGAKYAGGIVGYSSPYGETTITNCVNLGNITSNGYFAGGIAGKIFGKGNGDVSYLLNCCNKGNVEAKSNYSGGLAGASQGGYILNSYNRGDVVGSDYVGGLVGQQDMYDGSVSTTDNCYSINTVSGGTNTGVLVGYNNLSTIVNCHYPFPSSIAPIGGDNYDQTIDILQLNLWCSRLESRRPENGAHWVYGTEGDDIEYPAFQFVLDLEK